MGKKRMIGYLRVSTEEQANSGAGLEAQRAAVLARAEAEGWNLVHVVEDAGVSGSTPAPERSGLAAALAAIEAGKADGLVVSKLDRLTRSLLDFATLMERSRKKRWSLVALDLGVDTSTPSGEMMANVLATFAQFERRLIGQRTREALAAKRAQGVRLGRPPATPPELAERIHSERAAGATLQQIADGLNREGVNPVREGRRWYASTVRVVLSRAA